MSLLIAGLVGGTTHCAGMCAPFVLAQNGQVERLSQALLLPYHFGRMTTYVFMGVLVNAVIGIAFVNSDLKILITVPLLLTAAIMFIVTAFPVVSKLFPWVSSMRMPLPWGFISKINKFSGKNLSFAKRYVLGVMLGFMPCGLVVAALMAASTASSPLYAGFAMAAFTIGTMPALIAVAMGGKVLGRKFPTIEMKIKRFAMAASAVWLCFIAANMVF
ncbi:MAG: sulfite exporter TauE/SafE family protein [Pseudomonadota bacterium]|nr:sulfite exporter TauE/SafE family protein [Pseudomonadota bacterium]